MITQKGLTLIETLLYVAIMGMMIQGFVIFTLSISGTNSKAYVVQEVQANTRMALDVISQKIRAADDIITPSDGNATSTLVLDMPGLEPDLTFNVIGCLGLVRLPDLYNRLQASTKCVTLGTCSILFGTFIMVGFTAAGLKSLLCIVFLVLTSPVAAHAIARGAHRSGVGLCEGSIIDAYKDDKEGEA